MKRRRKRNKKKQAQGFVFPVPLALFLVMVTVTSMTYLWMYARSEAAGLRIQQLERRQEQTRQALAQEELRWTQMRTLSRVRAAVEKHGLDMTLAPSHRIVHLARPAGLDDVAVHSEMAQATVAAGDGRRGTP